MVVAWSALSYALDGAPAGIPRRVLIPNTWDSRGNWSVVTVSTLTTLVQKPRRNVDWCAVLATLSWDLQEPGNIIAIMLA